MPYEWWYYDEVTPEMYVNKRFEIQEFDSLGNLERTSTPVTSSNFLGGNETENPYFSWSEPKPNRVTQAALHRAEHVF